jgi:membrane protein implicated in regulation of membrane protease activity
VRTPSINIEEVIMSSMVMAQQLRARISIKNKIFALYLLALLLLALCPPLYLSVSGSSALLLGIPLPIVYWLAIAVFLGVGLWVMYLAECAFGEIPDDEEVA